MSKGELTFKPISFTDDGAPLVIEGRDEHGFICAQLKWDGCLNLWMLGTVEDGKEAWTDGGRASDQCEYVHLCTPIRDLDLILDFLIGARDQFKSTGNWAGEK